MSGEAFEESYHLVVEPHASKSGRVLTHQLLQST